MRNIDPDAWGGGDDRPYRPYLYPPEPVRKRHIVTTKDDTYIDENGDVVRVPIEERPAKRTRKVRRFTSFGVEEVDVEVDDTGRVI